MVKVVVWGGMLILALGGMVMGLRVMNADSGRLVGYAVGDPDAAGVCQLQVVVSLLDAMDNPPPVPITNTTEWDVWLNQHYALTDSGGHAVAMRTGREISPDVNDNQAGTAKFIAMAPLQRGQTYTLNVTPRVGEPEKYQQTIEATGKDFRRVNFSPNY